MNSNISGDPRTNWPSPVFTMDPADPSSACVIFAYPIAEAPFFRIDRIEHPAQDFWTPMRDKKVCDICEGYLASGMAVERLPHTECWEAWVIAHD